MAEKSLKDMKISDLQDKFLNITFESNSKDVYNHGVEPVLVAIKENTTEESAVSSEGFTKVYSAFQIPATDEAIKSPDTKGTLVASIYTNSDPKKNKIVYLTGTNPRNTYMQPTNAQGDVYRGIVTDTWVAGDPAIPFLQALTEVLRSIREIATFVPSFELLNTQEVINSIMEAPAKKSSVSTLPHSAEPKTVTNSVSKSDTTENAPEKDEDTEK